MPAHCTNSTPIPLQHELDRDDSFGSVRKASSNFENMSSSVRRKFGAQHEVRQAWNDPVSTTKQGEFVRAAPAPRLPATDRKVRPMDARIRLHPRGGETTFHTGVEHREAEGGVQAMLPLRKEAKDATRRADTLREEVVTSKIALVRSRIALAKKLGAEAGGGDKARKHGASEAEQLLATQDHLKFSHMLGKVGEVDEEVIALRREVLAREQESRALRVQKVKLDRLAASLKSDRLAAELSGTAKDSTISNEMLKLLQITQKLRAQILSQNEDAEPGQLVPHLDGTGSSALTLSKANTHPSTAQERLAMHLLGEKVKTLESDLARFHSLLQLDQLFDDQEVEKVVRDYLVEEHTAVYSLEVRTAPTQLAETDCEVYVQLCGSRGVTDRTLLYNPDVSTVFARGSTRCFEVRVAEDLGDLTAMTVWLGSTGAKDSWLLEDIVVWRVNGGGAAWVFPCGCEIRRETTLVAEHLVGEYCIYEVVVQCGTDEGAQEDDDNAVGVPRWMQLVLHGRAPHPWGLAGAICLRPLYALSGTDIDYVPTKQ